MQAGGELVAPDRCRPVVAEVADPGDRVFGEDDPAGDVRPAVGGEVGDQRQPAEVDVIAGHDVIADRAVVLQGERLCGTNSRLECLVQPFLGRIEKAGDPRPGCEQVGDNLVPAALDIGEPQQRVAILGCQFPHHGGDVLVQRHRLLDEDHVVVVRVAVARQKSVEVLVHGRHRVTALTRGAGVSQRRKRSCSMPNWSRILPTVWLTRSSIVLGRW